MFVRAKRSVHNGVAYEYLQIVRSYREGGAVRQQVLATLGRRDELLATGQLDGLLHSLGRFSERLRVIEAVRAGGLRARTARVWGPALVFGRLWERQGVPRLLKSLAAERKFEFDAERVALAMALQRLCRGGSDLQGSQWIHTVEGPGFEALALQHFYRTTGFLGEVRADLERGLFERDRDLFTRHLDVVFIDTTSVYVYRDTETPYRKRGYSRDHRPDLPQFVLCVVVNRDGWPIAWEIFPGNTADVKAFQQVVKVLRARLPIARVVVVADRGMISKDTISSLMNHPQGPWDYVLGCRMRQNKEVTQQVLKDEHGYERVESNLEVKDVRVGNRRYVVCRNPMEAAKDALTREAVLAKLQDTLVHHGPKAVIGNRGFARFVRVARGSVTVDPEAVERDARFDGLFVLTTRTEASAAQVARTYKSLWRVERTFREEKSTLEVRPIYHHRDDTSIGHIVGSFLALRLEVDLQRRLEDRGVDVSWPDLMRELAQVQAVEVELDGRRYRLRTDLPTTARQVFAAVGLRVPSPVTLLGDLADANDVDQRRAL
jgi:hypothetical protein